MQKSLKAQKNAERFEDSEECRKFLGLRRMQKGFRLRKVKGSLRDQKNEGRF